MLERFWRSEGYTMPNAERYPWQWLWDSCFHVIVWAELGDERAAVELATVFRHQSASGFVPHMGYQRHPGEHASFWGRADASVLTQPPMYGHAVAELVRRGVDIPAEVVERARAGLAWLLAHRRRGDGLLVICHPWESGADDSPRFDAWYPGPFGRSTWREVKGELVASLVVDDEFASVANPDFEVASASFNALVAFNLLELGEATGDAGLVGEGRALAELLDRQWDDECLTWADAPTSASASARTLDGLLAVLVVERDVWPALSDPTAYGATFGPAGVHRCEASFDPSAYWRGAAWPQLTYLLWVAARRRGRPTEAQALRDAMVAGVGSSGWSEYWHPDTGEGFGATPQSWATLAVVMDS